MKEIQIAGRRISKSNPPFVIAELSANHHGSIERALKIIDMAHRMGADAIKLQTYTPDTMTIKCDKEDFKIKGGLWDGYELYDLYAEAFTPFEWHKELFDRANELGMIAISTPFDESAVDLLESLNAPAYKIASFEIIDLALVRYVAQTRKPMIISTGMADQEEIEEAVGTAKANGARDIVLLHCISGYPTPVEQSNLKTIPLLEEKFNTLVGLSDHTLGTTVSTTSIGLGACVIEKHVTLSRSEKGPDSAFSLEPDELRRLCTDTLDAWKCLGKADFDRKPAEAANAAFRRSLYVVERVKAGEIISKNHIRSIRPGYGLPPKDLDKVIGKVARYDIEYGTPLSWELIE